jgi:hypothetical protein
MTQAKRKLPVPTLDERIEALKEEIDDYIASVVDRVAAEVPGVPKGVVERTITARAIGGGACKCSAYTYAKKRADG